MTEVKLLVQTAGLVLFDPAVLQAFIDHHHLAIPNLWESIRAKPDLEEEALATGCLLPVQPIAAWDYRVRVAVAAQPTVPAEWVLFAAPGFALHVSSGRVLVADGWAMLHWEAAAYLDGSQPLEANYAANEFQVVREVRVPNGWYQVTLVGFCERQNADLETRPCGYEFLLVRTEQAAVNLSGSLDSLDLDVVLL